MQEQKEASLRIVVADVSVLNAVHAWAIWHCALQDGSFLLAFAYWPGGTPEDWGDEFSGVHPCNPDDQAMLVRRKRLHSERGFASALERTVPCGRVGS